MNNLNSENKIISRFKLLLGSLVFIVIIGFISLISDLTQILESDWFKGLMSLNIVKGLPYFLNFLLAIFVIYLYIQLKEEYVKLSNALKSECKLSISLWRRYVRTLRSITLKTIATPNTRDALEPLLDELAKKLPENAVDFKIALAKPYADGSFKILAERGMDPASVYSIEQKSNWKEKKSFFSNGVYLNEESPYGKYESGELNYSNIQRKTGVGTSSSHFVIAIKDPVYPGPTFPENVLGVVSIGIPKKHDFSKDENELFYDKIFSSIKSIESMLLNQIIIEDKT